VRTFVFRCPATGYNVQGRHEQAEGPLPRFVGQHCLACGGMHVVNPLNGRLMAEEVPGSPDGSDATD